jgi:hypothetical protein
MSYMCFTESSMPLVKVNSEGQITLPDEIRERLNLRPVNTAALAKLRGMLYQPGREAVSVEEMNEAIGESACDRQRDH